MRVDLGDGNDRLTESSDLQVPVIAQGGAGNDVLRPDGHEDANADYVDGGPDVDRIDEDYSSRYLDRFQQPFVSLDLGGAPSGRPGEGDTIHNVEQVVLCNGGSVTGTDASEAIEYDEVGDPITVNAAGGDDTITTGDGNDTITGGAGNDTINAGYGNDTIDPGPGQDIVHADSTGECNWLYCKYPYGDDTIDARDGEVDHIDCGAGTDTVLADPQDIVDPSCENVTRSGGSGGAGGSGDSGGSAGSGGQGRDGGRTQVRLTVIRTRLSDALAHGLRVRVAGASAGTMVRLQAKVGRSVAARGSRHAGHSGSATVTLRFTATARRALHGKRTARLVISGNGRPITVTLKRH